MTQSVQRTDASREAGEWAQKTSPPPTTGSANPPPCQTVDFKKWSKQKAHAFSPKQTMASIVKGCGTLTVRGDIKTVWKQWATFPLLSFSPLKSQDNFLLQLGHKRWWWWWSGAGGGGGQSGCPLLRKICLCLPVVLDLTQLNRADCNSIRAPGGLSCGRTWHTSTENVNTSLKSLLLLFFLVMTQNLWYLTNILSMWAISVLKRIFFLNTILLLLHLFNQQCAHKST